MAARDDYAYSVIIFISLLHLITATHVCYVTPDNQSHINNDCPIDHECHTLQYYLRNSSKYFTSNTQLHLLQGNHYINVDIVLDSLHNFSLVGSGVNNTVVECFKPSLIAIINCTNTDIKNFTIGSKCGALKNRYFDISKHITLFMAKYGQETVTVKRPTKNAVAVYILNSHSTAMHSVTIKRHGMSIVNGLGKTTLTNVVHYHHNLEILYITIYNDLTILQRSSSSVLQIINFRYYHDKNYKIMQWYIIMIEFWQEYHNTYVNIENTTFQSLNSIRFVLVQFTLCNRMNHTIAKFVTIKNCQFLNNKGTSKQDDAMISVTLPSCYEVIDDILDPKPLLNSVAVLNNMNIVQIVNSSFISNYVYHTASSIVKLNLLVSYPNISRFLLLDCIFENNYNFAMLNIGPSPMASVFITILLGNRKYLYCDVTISNVLFMLPGSGEDITVIHCAHTLLHLNGPLIFSNFKNTNSSIIVTENTNITFHGYNKFLNADAFSLLHQKELNYVQLKEALLINISNSTFSAEIFHTDYHVQLDGIPLIQILYPLCFFQYISDNGDLDQKFAQGILLNFTIAIHKTEAHSLSNLHTTHCSWNSKSAFNTTIPLLVNQRFISHFDKWNDILNVPTIGSLCTCSDSDGINCSIDILGPIYPGQNVVFHFALINAKENANKSIPITLETMNYSPSQCTTPIVKTQQNFSSHECSNVTYTIFSHSNVMCELLLKEGNDTIHGVKVNYTKFYIKLLPCPPGFMFMQMRCQCDPILTLNKHVIDCDINDQTVLRSPNSWIFYNESLHTYRLSKSCPFQYCYHHSTKLHLDNPNLQCQFKRSGVLCGQCQQDLSTIFGSFDCQRCSNVNLFLIILIAVSGILLVIIMFALNLTVSEGTITPFILYVNILSIHSIPLFPSHSALVKPLHVFVSLTNLNLGIKTCFYNGMNDYTKTWLQFTFTVYLIMIITLIIISSRYSIVIQRLTLHKTVPVLATILLLSYTKILQTVCDVLFLYSTITDYPSNVSRVMWSIDANVPLFGLRHSVLFAFSLLMVILLVLYTCLLLFGKILRNFKISVHINPLLNAYNKAYKKNCCYWIGYELIIRCVLLATLLAVNNSTINLIIGNSFLAMVQFNYQHPYQNPVNNFSQIVLNLNLLILYSTSLIFPEDQDMRLGVVNAMIVCGVAQFMFMIIINQLSFRCRNINAISYVQHKLFSKKKSSNADMLLLARQD